MTSEVDLNSSQTALIGHAVVKAPPFYRKSPETWFRQLDSQFLLAGITKTETKFHHVVANLPEDIACDALGDSNIKSYDDLKKAILTSLQANKHIRIEEALATLHLGDKRPTQFVMEIKRRFNDVGLGVDDTIIKSRLLSAIPANMRASLIGHDDVSLDQYARIADSIMAVASRETPFINVNAVGTSDSRTAFNPRQNEGQKKFSGVRPFYPDQRPMLCNSHIFFADRARSCRRWCRWPGRKPEMLRENERTPHQSRPASPTN